MNPIDEAELSGLLDGELDPERAAFVRQAIDRYPALKAQFERLSKLDGSCRRVAAQVSFSPRVVLPAAPSPHVEHGFEIKGPTVAIALLGLVAIYFAPKILSGLLIGMSLHAGALVAVLWMISRAVSRNEMRCKLRFNR